MQHMQRGRIFGIESIWYSNGVLKSEPTEEDIKIRNKREELYKEIIQPY